MIKVALMSNTYTIVTFVKTFNNAFIRLFFVLFNRIFSSFLP